MNSKQPWTQIARNRAHLRLKVYETLMIAYMLIWIWLALDILWIQWLPLNIEVLVGIVVLIAQIPTTIRLNRIAKDIDRSDRFYRLRKKWFN